MRFSVTCDESSDDSKEDKQEQRENLEYFTK